MSDPVRSSELLGVRHMFMVEFYRDLSGKNKKEEAVYMLALR